MLNTSASLRIYHSQDRARCKPSEAMAVLCHHLSTCSTPDTQEIILSGDKAVNTININSNRTINGEVTTERTPTTTPSSQDSHVGASTHHTRHFSFRSPTERGSLHGARKSSRGGLSSNFHGSLNHICFLSPRILGVGFSWWSFISLHAMTKASTTTAEILRVSRH